MVTPWWRISEYICLKLLILKIFHSYKKLTPGPFLWANGLLMPSLNNRKAWSAEALNTSVVPVIALTQVSELLNHVKYSYKHVFLFTPSLTFSWLYFSSSSSSLEKKRNFESHLMWVVYLPYFTKPLVFIYYFLLLLLVFIISKRKTNSRKCLKILCLP